MHQNPDLNFKKWFKFISLIFRSRRKIPPPGLNTRINKWNSTIGRHLFAGFLKCAVAPNSGAGITWEYMALVLALNPFSDFKCSTSPQADTVIKTRIKDLFKCKQDSIFSKILKKKYSIDFNNYRNGKK